MAVRHIVIWKLNNRTVPLAKCEDALAIRDALLNLKGRIPGLLHLDVGFDYSEKESAGDVVLVTDFESREALANYQHHPEHVNVGSVVRPRVCDRRMIDYELSE